VSDLFGEPPAEPLLPDGTYDAFIVDATEVAADGSLTEGRVMHLELTITSGKHKGEVLGVAARGLHGEEFELLGMPATLTITDGTPAVRIDA
jgi:hypothetical protein